MLRTRRGMSALDFLKNTGIYMQRARETPREMLGTIPLRPRAFGVPLAELALNEGAASFSRKEAVCLPFIVKRCAAAQHRKPAGPGDPAARLLLTPIASANIAERSTGERHG